MLSEFLIQNKREIIQLCKDKVLKAGGSKPTSKLLDAGLPVFYNEIVDALQTSAASTNDERIAESGFAAQAASAHGKESLRLGYTISQVVHAYGAVCQSITEMAEAKSFTITANEFKDFNLYLDVSIAEAVTGFDDAQRDITVLNETERLGFLIHEMGNSLAAASIAHSMIQKGQVGSAGSTSKMLGRAHDRMRHLIDSSLAELRLRGHAVELAPLRLLDIINEVEATSLMTAKDKTISLEIDVDPTTYLNADHHLLFSALSNILSNAIKFTHKFGKVIVRGKTSGENIVIEVEDACGGLPEGDPEQLFTSFLQAGTDRTGMGLGLSLSRRAIELNQGKLTVHNLPGKGCIFTISLPKDKRQ